MNLAAPHRRDERGAVAILTALLAMVLFGTAALAVDLGNEMSRKRVTQGTADMAALAGASNLPDTSDVTIQAVANYLNQNAAPSDGTANCNPDAGQTVTTTMLKDGSLLNGEVTFPAANTIKVVSPAARVDFGMAKAIGFNNGCVSSVATAKISSSGIGMAPYYTTPSCASGPETLKDNSGGLSLPYQIPPLFANSDTNGSSLSGISPGQIALAAVGDPDGPTITLTGNKLSAADVDMVGFFSSDQTAPKTKAPATQSNNSLTVVVPNTVASYQDVWYVRVRSKTTGKWSAVDSGSSNQAQSLLVGASVLSCDVGPSSGNFGSIDFPWGSNDNDDLTSAIQNGPHPPETLKVFPSPLPADNACNNDSRGIISTDGSYKINTNCVNSVTGLKAMPAYDGYLDPSKGKLMVDTSPACTALGQPARSATLNTNADLLTCFLKNDSLKLADAVNYNGTQPLFTQDIYKSPRFVLVPILNHDPNGTKWMPIIGFVPGFITDQPTGASRSNPEPGTQTDNGLVVQSGKKLRAVRIFFFSMGALPPPPDGGTLMDYIGGGPKVIQLTN